LGPKIVSTQRIGKNTNVPLRQVQVFSVNGQIVSILVFIAQRVYFNNTAL
jgi:hypothetical protein